jgi:subtilisin-like proprotein convertase family protein
MTSNGKPIIESKVTVNSGGAIKNMEIRQLKGYHEFFKDLDVHLISPQGTDITLWTAKCGNYNGVFNLRLTDEAPNAFACPPPTNGAAYRPQNPLAPLIGENSTGTWTLRASDTEIGGGGVFEAFQLEFCSEVTVNPPYLVNNNPLYLDPGNNKGIDTRPAAGGGRQ